MLDVSRSSGAFANRARTGVEYFTRGMRYGADGMAVEYLGCKDEGTRLARVDVGPTRRARSALLVT